MINAFGSLAWNLSPMLPTLFAIIFGLVIFYLYYTRVGQVGAWERARGQGRRTASWARRISAGFQRNNQAQARFEEEFRAVIGVSSRSYLSRSLLYGALMAMLLYLLTGSLVLTVGLGLGTAYWRQSRAGGKLTRAASQALDSELIFYARHIGRSLERSASLQESLYDLVRSDPETPLKRSLRRALASTRTLEIGLRAEAEFATQQAVREFFEILAEGATSVQRGAITRAALDRYIDLNTRRRTVFQKALTMTAQARSTRTIMLFTIPVMYMISVLRAGGDVLFHSLGGNIITAFVLLCIFGAIYVSNLVLARALRGF
jgi:hypothetical protein